MPTKGRGGTRWCVAATPRLESHIPCSGAGPLKNHKNLAVTWRTTVIQAEACGAPRPQKERLGGPHLPKALCGSESPKTTDGGPGQIAVGGASSTGEESTSDSPDRRPGKSPLGQWQATTSHRSESFQLGGRGASSAALNWIF